MDVAFGAHESIAEAAGDGEYLLADQGSYVAKAHRDELTVGVGMAMHVLVMCMGRLCTRWFEHPGGQRHGAIVVAREAHALDARI